MELFSNLNLGDAAVPCVPARSDRLPVPAMRAFPQPLS